MSFSRREKVLLVVLAAVAVLAGGFWTLDLPAFSTCQSETALLRDARLRRGQAEQAVRDAPGAEQMVDAAAWQAAQSSGALLPAMDAETLEVWLVALAQRSGMKVSAVSLGALRSADIGAEEGAESAGTPGTASGAVPLPGAPAVRYRLGDFLKAYRGQGSPAPASPAGGKAAAGTARAPAVGAGTAVGTVLERDVTLAYDGRDADLFAFMDLLEGSGRTALVTAFSTENAAVTVACFGAEKPAGGDELFAWSRYAK